MLHTMFHNTEVLIVMEIDLPTQRFLLLLMMIILVSAFLFTIIGCFLI